ncbi:hypothetical protein HMPREF0494_1125 [Limosilactobacillus antri DSM 16041]|uniref:Uncharacterized protein n=1 Tax=Limosilactobacillus antri DSM 16041 TaxID=525309 RepID=C8P731_9LACO|nr:hypothetical protein HMPREF0494_1125 [Limosilactobacillus antri DSM 16041]
MVFLPLSFLFIYFPGFSSFFQTFLPAANRSPLKLVEFMMGIPRLL